MATLQQATPSIIPEDTTQLPPEDQGVIERFKARIAEFRSLFARLQGARDQVPAEMQEDYQGLVDRGTTIQGTIDTITSGINTAVNWFKGAFGLNAVNLSQRGQLGAIPLLPVAAIAGAMALIGYWITDTMQFIQRMEQFEQMRAQGVPAAEAAQAVQTATTGGPIFGLDIQKMVIPLVIVAGVLWFMRNKGL